MSLVRLVVYLRTKIVIRVVLRKSAFSFLCKRHESAGAARKKSAFSLFISHFLASFVALNKNIHNHEIE